MFFNIYNVCALMHRSKLKHFRTNMSKKQGLKRLENISPKIQKKLLVRDVTGGGHLLKTKIKLATNNKLKF